MLSTERYTEVTEVLATLAPITANGAVGPHVTGYADFADFHRGFVEFHVGTPGGASTIDITLQQAQDTAGTGAKELTDITGVTLTKAPAQIVAADAGEFCGIEINTPELDVTNGYHCIQVTVTVAVDTFTYGLKLLGVVPRYEPTDVTNYMEIVA